MRGVVILGFLVLAWLAGAYVDRVYDWPFRLTAELWPRARPNGPEPAGPTASPHVPGTAPAEPAGPANGDWQHCVNTLVARKEALPEAQTVCHKIISGIGG